MFLACGNDEDGLEQELPSSAQQLAVPLGNLPGDSLYTKKNGWENSLPYILGTMEVFLGQDFDFVDSQGLFTINRNDSLTWPLSETDGGFMNMFDCFVRDDSTLVYNSGNDVLIRTGVKWLFKTHIRLNVGDSITTKLLKHGDWIDTLEVRMKYSSSGGLWSPLVYWVKYNGLLVWDVVSNRDMKVCIRRNDDGSVSLFDKNYQEYD